jgi:hypothetical protein
MAANRMDIERWLKKLYEDDSLTHMIVVCDDFDWEDYPVYVSKHEDVRKKKAEFAEKSMQRVMEVYSRNHTLEEQMAERRAFHYD